MKAKTIYSLVLVLICFSIEAWSSTQLQILSSSNPFQVLKSAFEKAKPANINDIPNVTDIFFVDSKIKCAAFVETNGQPAKKLVEAILGKFNYVIKGEESVGPLFPGTSDQTMTSIVQSFAVQKPDQKVTNEYILNLIRNNQLLIPIVSQSTAGDLQTIYSAPNYLYKAVYRKLGSEIYFREIATNDLTKIRSEVYGYCWQE